MVRREEQEWQSRCTLLIDNRRISHRGYGVDSSMETAVRAAASIMRNLVALDFEVRLVSATGHSSAHGWHQAAHGATLPEQLERLALMRMTRTERLSTGWVDESHHGGMLLAVLGHLGEGDRSFLAGLATAGASAHAVVLDVSTWDRVGAARAPGHCCAARGRVEGDHARARRFPACRLDGAGAMTSTTTADPFRRPTRSAMAARGWHPGPPLLGLFAGWVALFSWSGMVAEPSDFLVPTLFVGLLMALAGSGLRMLRVAPYAVAAVQVVIALLSLNVIFAARPVPARRDPDRWPPCARSCYVIRSGAATLNTYSAPGRGQPDAHPGDADGLRPRGAAVDRRARDGPAAAATGRAPPAGHPQHPGEHPERARSRCRSSSAPPCCSCGCVATENLERFHAWGRETTDGPQPVHATLW